MILMMTGKREKNEVQNVAIVVREALVIFNIWYSPEGIQKAH